MTTSFIELIELAGNHWLVIGTAELHLERLASAYSNVSVKVLVDDPTGWEIAGPSLDRQKLAASIYRLCEADEFIAQVDSAPMAAFGAIRALASLPTPETAVAILSYLPGRKELAIKLVAQSDAATNHQDAYVFKAVGGARFENIAALDNIARKIAVPVELK